MTIAIGVKMDKYRGIVTDTALVCETTDGNYIRTGETEDKVFLKDDSAIFCSGCMGVCNHIRRYILEMKDFSIEKVVDYLKYLNSIDPISNDDMAIIIIDKDKITGIKANNNFEPTYFEGDSIVSTGIFMVDNKEISSDEGNALANSKFTNHILETRNVSKALVKTAKDFLNTKVGGKLKLFTYDDELKKFKLSYTEKVDNLLEDNREKAKQISNNKLFKPARYKTWLNNDDIDYSTFHGNIDASIITGSSLNGGSINIGEGNFLVKPDGSVTSNGDFYLLGNIRMGGNITWDSPVVQYQYSVDNINWHTTMTSNDKYRRESLDNGATWQNSYKFVAIDGINGSDANVNDVNVFKALTEGGKFQGIFSDESGKLYMNAQYIRSGTLSGVTIDVDTEATIGKKLIINADDFLGGIEFRYDDGTGEKIAEIYVDPAGKSLNIEADGGINIKSSDNGKVYLNNVEFTGTQPKIIATFG